MPDDERPLLRPGTVLLHRGGRPGVASIQLGLEPGSAVRLDVPARSCDAVLAGLDGTRSTAEVLSAAVARGADPSVARALLDRLRTAGALVDAGSWPAWTHDGEPAGRDRRLPDLQAWDRHDDGGIAARRAAASVRVIGAGRVGAALAQLLNAAGVRRLDVVDAGLVTPADLTPYGYRSHHLGRRRTHALRDLLGSSDDGNDLEGGDAHVEILCGDACEPDRDDVATLMRSGTPHLLVRCRETSGTVGPFVLPGRSACVRCTDLHRADRDPDWPGLLSQLAAAAAPVPETVLAIQLAGLAAAQVLHRLAGDRPATAGRSIEVMLPGGTSRVTDWPPHPYCGCHWPEQLADETR